MCPEGATTSGVRMESESDSVPETAEALDGYSQKTVRIERRVDDDRLTFTLLTTE